jgi:PAS domain-containing protein
LKAEIATAAIGGPAIERQVRIAGSDRVLEVRGGLAGAPYEHGTLLLWMFDTSSAEAERLKLTTQLHQTELALDSLTHLIESAPFPMWYRGPDMSLGLVNSAFVAAVEARDAAEVIARGSELIDSPGDESARAGALAALEVGRPFVRTQPATIGGERRMLKLVDVPLSTGAVAGFAIDIQDLEDARFELAQHIESQRELADRMTAGVVQFDADRTLSFFNQPFAVMAQIEPESLAEKPEFDRLLERMRENGRLPEVRDFPAWKAERRDWFISTAEVFFRGLDPRQRRPLADRCPALAGWRRADDRGGPHRAGPSLPRRAIRCSVSEPRPSTTCSKRSACLPATAGSISGTSASARCGIWTNNGCPSIRASTSLCRPWPANWSTRPPPLRCARWSAARQAAAAPAPAGCR